MPPASVPWLLLIRLLEISRLWAHPCAKMPPPPWELLMTDKPSMRDGLHWKLLGNRLGLVIPSPLPQSWGTPLRSVVPSGKISAANGLDPLGKRTPFESTVIPAPS